MKHIKKRIILFPDLVLAKVVIFLIKIYQKTFSPDHGIMKDNQPFSGCKFWPSCSHYGIQTLEKYGFVFGMPRVIWRVLRCHPWAKGGIDEV